MKQDLLSSQQQEIHYIFLHPFNADQTVSTMSDPCSFTVPVIAGSISGVIVVAIIVIVVVIVIIVCLQHLKFKKRACQRDRELQLIQTEEERSQQNENHREMDRQWSRDRVNKLLDGLRGMQEIIRATNDTELFRNFLADCTKLTMELYGEFLSCVATDGEEERNGEIEKAQKEQLLNLLRHILKGGRRNKSLKEEMLRTIVDEMGSEVNDYVEQK